MGTHLRATGRHLPCGITQCYLPPDTSERAPLTRSVLDLPTPVGWKAGWKRTKVQPAVNLALNSLLVLSGDVNSSILVSAAEWNDVTGICVKFLVKRRLALFAHEHVFMHHLKAQVSSVVQIFFVM